MKHMKLNPSPRNLFVENILAINTMENPSAIAELSTSTKVSLHSKCSK
ncbi:hypothetical protein SEUBUCD650_0B06310 [Saccharomyces eubayanus]|uniref:Uncharacterized protein n=1 Tax=Saccharomyces eubayanus TaxID=1080349 RepID=A0ABN8VL81_SACEU|nr:hypothetical protein SEUBUCD650_0B06310 [Saccharomyces eubayanus]